MRTIKILLCFSLFFFSFDRLSFNGGNALSAQSWQWAIQDSGTGSGSLFSCTDSIGNTYITGNIHLTNINFNSCGNVALGAGYYLSVFVAKYDQNGNCVWVNNAECTSSTGVGSSGIAVDRHGNILVTGGYQDSIFFGNVKLGGGGMFVAKYDNNGNVLWVKQCSGGAPGVSVDRECNIYLTGEISGSLGGCALPGYKLVMKLDSNGNCVWAKGTASIKTEGGE